MSFSAATHGKYILGVSLKQRELQAGRDLSQKPAPLQACGGVEWWPSERCVHSERRLGPSLEKGSLPISSGRSQAMKPGGPYSNKQTPYGSSEEALHILTRSPQLYSCSSASAHISYFLLRLQTVLCTHPGSLPRALDDKVGSLICPPVRADPFPGPCKPTVYLTDGHNCYPASRREV